jgi:hypothetical protein
MGLNPTLQLFGSLAGGYPSEGESNLANVVDHLLSLNAQKEEIGDVR